MPAPCCTQQIIYSGRRTAHLADHADPAPEAVIFTSPSGGLLRHSNFYRRVWLPALTATALPGVHINDLRHTGNVLIANAGADPRELMERMGHSTSRAALIYLHSTSARQRELAETAASPDRAHSGHAQAGHSCGVGPLAEGLRQHVLGRDDYCIDARPAVQRGGCLVAEDASGAAESR